VAGFAQRAGATSLVVLAALTLTACGSIDTDTATSATLATTKSPVQLLRNEAAGRIPPAVIESVTETEDTSIACLDEDEDPRGLSRSWHSSARVLVEDASAWRVDAVVDGVADSFVEQGWVARPLGGSATTRVILLSSKTSPAEIELSATRPDPEAVDAAAAPVDEVTIELSVHGPCVTTDGADSDAVKELEERS
jgi:hypothetical protein